MTEGLERSRRAIRSARHSADGGFYEAAVSRAYYATFYAATIALETLGESRSKHSALIAAFGELVVHRTGFDPDIARVFRKLFEARNDAEYAGLDVDETEAAHAIEDAERFLEAVARWLAARRA